MHHDISSQAARRGRFVALRPLLAASIAAVALTGCNETDEPTPQDYNDVATSVGSLVGGGGGEVASFSDSVDTAQGEIPAGFSSSGSGEFEGNRGGLRYSYEVTCTDAGGDVMAACDATTDAASLIVDWSGSYEGNLWQFSVSRTGDWSISGLQSDTAAFNGQGTFDVTSDSQSLDGRVSRSFVLSYAASYEDVLVDTASHEVTGGVIVYHVNAQRHVDGRANERDAEFDITAEVVFDGSGSASLVLDGSRSYRIDLTSGAVTAE